MYRRVLSFCGALLIGSSVHAATLDFSDAAFATSTDGADATVTVDGVTFTVTPTARGADGFRQDPTGLKFGIPGNGMNTLSIVASEDVTFESVTGVDNSLTGFTTPAQFFGSAGTVNVLSALQLPTALGNVDFADFTLAAGDAFVFQFDFTARAGFSAVFSTATIAGFEFSKAGGTPQPSPVPLPAGLPLLLAGLGAFGYMRRKQGA